MAIVKIKKKGKESLYASFLMMTLVPLLVFGLIVTSFISYLMRQTINRKTTDELRVVTNAALASFDSTYPGDYTYVEDAKGAHLYKGEQCIDKETRVIDAIKESSGIETTIYFTNASMVTTITDKEGKRYVLKPCADNITEDVFINGKKMFYDNVKINGVPYYAYYEPIYSLDGAVIVGMIGVAKSAVDVQKTINSAILKNFLIMIIFMLITAYIIVRYTSKLMECIRKILDFLGKLAGNNLGARLDETVQNRNDELGEIGQASVKLQLSLRKLIERDALTSLYNRRAAEKKLDDLEKAGIKSSISIGDIDFFKKFNDSFGHECGDVVLKEVAATLNEGMRGKGFVARWGGEEFLLVFENIEELKAGLILTDILQAVRDRQVVYNGQTHAVTMTFGVTGREDNEKVADQIRRADDMLYEGKQGGRNRVIIGNSKVEEEAEAENEVVVEAQTEQAIEVVEAEAENENEIETIEVDEAEDSLNIGDKKDE